MFYNDIFISVQGYSNLVMAVLLQEKTFITPSLKASTFHNACTYVNLNSLNISKPEMLIYG